MTLSAAAERSGRSVAGTERVGGNDVVLVRASEMGKKLMRDRICYLQPQLCYCPDTQPGCKAEAQRRSGYAGGYDVQEECPWTERAVEKVVGEERHNLEGYSGSGESQMDSCGDISERSWW